MTGPRTQFETVYRSLVGPLFSTAGFQEIKREAIPWCTTHNQIALGVDAYAVCYDPAQVPAHQLDYWGQSEPAPNRDGCVISTGGPDHKWWKDES